MKAIIITNDSKSANRVFTAGIRAQLAQRYELYDTLINKKNVAEHSAFVKDAEFLFATWGMQRFTEEEIREYFPSAKAVFYAAGSVQGFAREFLNCGIRVFSAWKANAIPVAEFTYAQIILGAKGFYRAERKAKSQFYSAAKFASECGGNFNTSVGIIGVGGIGSLVAEKLKQNDIRVLYYDPYLSEERAKELNIESAALERIFAECDVITNHLANKDELAGILEGKLFSSMKPYAVFINTGRGRQVDEKGLVKALRKVKTRTALLDVTSHEPPIPFCRLSRCKNVIITPHIAGSIGREVVRMAVYMTEEAERVAAGAEPLYEVTAEMLGTMA